MPRETNTTAPQEETNPALVPKLRFPGFMIPWVNEPLSEVLTEHKIRNTEGRDVFSVSMEHGIVNQIELLGRSFAAADTSHYTIGRRYDVVYTKSPLKAFPFGVVKQCKFDGEIALSPLYLVFTPSSPQVGLMIEAYFESPNRSVAFLAPLCQKGAKNTIQITSSTFLSGKLSLPIEATEQLAIAECLSSVDELIASQARKVDALTSNRKWLTQQLFPREGESQPRLRFSEFHNAREWATRTFAELYDFKPTNTLSRDNLSYESGSVRNIHYGDIHTRYSTSFRIHEESVPFVKSTETALKQRPDAYCQEGDLVFADASEDVTDVGKSIELVELHGEIVLSGSHTILARQKANVFEVGFAGHLFKGRAVRAQIERESQGTKVLQISPVRLAGIRVAFPEDRDEQRRIAACLASLDALIAANTHKHAALQRHKRGLMQQLFPSPVEAEA
jgi:type I restriction enzyme, S subunit